MNDMITMNANTALAQALGIATPATPTPNVPAPRPAPPIASNTQIEDDSQYARENIYGLIENGAKAIEDVMDVARESQHPRAYEVLGQLLKIQSDNVDKLLALQKNKKALLAPAAGEDAAMQAPQNINVANAIFVGSSSELVRMMRKEHVAPKTIELDDSDE